MRPCSSCLGLIASLTLPAFTVVAQGLPAQSVADPRAETAESAAPPMLDIEHLPKPRLHATFTPGAWLSRVSGDVEFSGASHTINLENDLELDGSEAALRGEVNVRSDRWDVWASAFAFDTEAREPAPFDFTADGLDIRTGDALESELDLSALSLDVGYAFQPINRRGVQMRFSPTVGIRYVDLDHVIRAPLLPGSPQASFDSAAIGLSAGARLAIEIDRRWTFGVDGSAGLLSNGGTMATISAGITWHPHPNIGVAFGYRLVALAMEDDEEEYDGRLAGLFFGASVQF